jgi:16S rRNA (uracil1498-N3)-methyltransferase
MTEISTPIDIGAVCADWRGRGTAIVLHQLGVPLQRTLTQILAEHRPGDPIALLVGPEGGFADEEVSALVTGGFLPVLLKTNILRAETAAVVATALVQQLLVDNL